MTGFPEASKKAKVPSFATYPIGYDMIRDCLEPYLPAEEFMLGFYGLDSRLAKSRDFSPITIFRLEYLPSKWRESHWGLYVYGALRKDKAAIRDAMQAVGFSLLIEFLASRRDPLWKELAFRRSIVWDAKTGSLSNEDYNQIEGETA